MRTMVPSKVTAPSAPSPSAAVETIGSPSGRAARRLPDAAYGDALRQTLLSAGAWGWQYAIGEDPFHFGPFRVMGAWHAANMFRDGDHWTISHTMQNPGKSGVRASERKPYRGVCLAGLVWARDYPFVTDLQDVLEGWAEERKE